MLSLKMIEQLLKENGILTRQPRDDNDFTGIVDNLSSGIALIKVAYMA